MSLWVEFQEKLDLSWAKVTLTIIFHKDECHGLDLFGGNLFWYFYLQHHVDDRPLPLTDVKVMLEDVGIRLPAHKVRDILKTLKDSQEVEGDAIEKQVFHQVTFSIHL